ATCRTKILAARSIVAIDGPRFRCVICRSIVKRGEPGMYRRVLLAYDGSLEGAIALREGAIMAKHLGAEVFLLSVVPHLAGLQVAEGVHGGVVAHELDRYREVLGRGVDRLARLGFKPVSKLAIGDPARVIGEFAREVHADLV